jgi:hypothetical protein
MNQSTRLAQLVEVCKVLGLPENTPIPEIITAFQKAATGKDSKALLAKVGQFISIPDGVDPVAHFEAVLQHLKFLGNRSIPDEALVNRSKATLRDAIADGRLKQDNTTGHKAWLDFLTTSPDTAQSLLNSSRPNLGGEHPIARRFIATVRAEQAAGLSKSKAVDVARKTNQKPTRFGSKMVAA